MKKNSLMRKSSPNTKKISAQLSKTSKKLKKDVSKSALDLRDGAVERSKDMGVAVDRAARKNPWAFIGGAAATSMIAGAMLGMRNRKERIKQRMKRR